MKRAFFIVVAMVLPALSASCLNPAFVAQTTGNRLYPQAPGDQPFLLVRVVNDTQAMLNIPITYDDGTGAKTFLVRNLSPAGREVGVLLDWPITRVGIGSLDNPFLPSVTVALPNGTNVLIPVNQFALQAGVDFQRGDAILFRFTAAAQNPAAIGVTVARINGADQTGPFTRADTFLTVSQILQLTAASSGSGT